MLAGGSSLRDIVNKDIMGAYASVRPRDLYRLPLSLCNTMMVLDHSAYEVTLKKADTELFLSEDLCCTSQIRTSLSRVIL